MKDNIVERQTCEGKGGSLRTNQMNFLLKDAVPLWGHILSTMASHIDTNIFRSLEYFSYDAFLCRTTPICT